jgi:hypothetical protein
MTSWKPSGKSHRPRERGSLPSSRPEWHRCADLERADLPAARTTEDARSEQTYGDPSGRRCCTLLLYPFVRSVRISLLTWVKLRRFELLTSCMPSGGSTSTRVHPCRSPSSRVSARPPPSMCVAVLPCCTRPPAGSVPRHRGQHALLPPHCGVPATSPPEKRCWCRCATSLCRPGGLRPSVNRRTSCSVSSLI